MSARTIHSPVGDERMRAALAWLAGRPRHAKVLVVAATLDAGQQLLRHAVARGGSAFGWYCESLSTLAGKLAQLPLARASRSPLGAFGVEALAARAVFELRGQGALGRFEPVAELPGLPRALARTLGELSLAGVAPEHAALDPDLSRLFARYLSLLTDARLADRAQIFAAAAQAAREPAQPPLGLPLLLWDVRVGAGAERELVAALAEAAPECLALAPSRDTAGLRQLELALGVSAEPYAGAEQDGAGESALRRLQRQLFTVPERLGELGEAVAILSAPGEARECVEIARRVLREAERGVAFDRMAILLRAPELYRAPLIEALRRARVPAYFSRGSVRPEPAGRALLALLACAAENLSARRFAEYLSLGVMAQAGEGKREVEWVPGADPLMGASEPESDTDTDSESDTDSGTGTGTESDTEPDPLSGTVRAPRRWEQLLVDAAVIGSKARWQRRLDGLLEELGLRLRECEAEDEPRRDGIAREIEALRGLREFALPLITTLSELPARATWGEWLTALSALAMQAIDAPGPVLQGLSELQPMAPVGPVGIAEVRLVLERRLGEQLVKPFGSGDGKLKVLAIEEARGMVFDVVFVPGLAEKIFPPKLSEDPLLLDAARARLSAELAEMGDRVGDERAALQLAIGAARERLVVSYPRFAAERGRPRVPSFYALEVLRAAEGELPGFGELQRRATEACDARMGWPAPRVATDAIDAAEYDLVVLSEFLGGGGAESRWSGAAHYLLSVNPHLGRALRFRARRWHRKWHAADGLVSPGEAASHALARHGLRARAYSATALEHYAHCPYRFYLAAVLGLAPRAEAAAIETLGGAERGALVHEVLRLFWSALREERMLPLAEEHAAQARARLDAVLDAVAERYRERLAPAIERVWQDGVDDVRADLHDLLVRAIAERAWVPAHFELGFGVRRAEHDPASQGEAVALPLGLTLRGSIDLVERQGGELRAVDYKTGVARDGAYFAIAGGRMLQPALYAHALEQLFPGMKVVSGQAYHCTARGGFRRLEVAHDVGTTARVELAVQTIGGALAEGFLPAAPDKDACERCDYAVVCGPYEAQRAAAKDGEPLKPLVHLRREP